MFNVLAMAAQPMGVWEVGTGGLTPPRHGVALHSRNEGFQCEE